MDLIYVHDDFRKIVPEGAQLERLAGGFQFTEGPVWSRQEECLYFSDIPASTVYSWKASEGVQVVRQPSAQTNGLTINHQGHLLACEHESRTVSLRRPDGEVTTLLSHFNGKRLNSPNDIVVKSDGSVYFTDPPYGLSDPSQQELPFQGVYRYEPDSGLLQLLAQDFDRPNGLAFSPDERILYVDDSARQHVRAFDVADDGSLRNGRIFAELDPHAGSGVPDGLKVDDAGNVYVTGPGGVWIIAADRRVLGVIRVPEIAANVAWGGVAGTDLFITASTSLYRIRLLQSGRIPEIKTESHGRDA